MSPHTPLGARAYLRLLPPTPRRAAPPNDTEAMLDLLVDVQHHIWSQLETIPKVHTGDGVDRALDQFDATLRELHDRVLIHGYHIGQIGALVFEEAPDQRDERDPDL